MTMRTLTRRQMIIATGAGGAGIAALLTVPAVGFLLSPLFEKTRVSLIRVGPVDQVPVGTPTPFTVGVPTGEAYDTTPVNRIVYVVRKPSGDVLPLTNVCTHMQCDVHWDAALDQFLCPCHGGLYDMDGLNVGGPPPSPLPRWVHRLVEENGQTVLYIQNKYEEAI
jgi:menaquinol-cytochrome c reductase iron-sulfur subunit